LRINLKNLKNLTITKSTRQLWDTYSSDIFTAIRKANYTISQFTSGKIPENIAYDSLLTQITDIDTLISQTLWCVCSSTCGTYEANKIKSKPDNLIKKLENTTSSLAAIRIYKRSQRQINKTLESSNPENYSLQEIPLATFQLDLYFKLPDLTHGSITSPKPTSKPFSKNTQRHDPVDLMDFILGFL
jgi:hypothetical protein